MKRHKYSCDSYSEALAGHEKLFTIDNRLMGNFHSASAFEMRWQKICNSKAAFMDSLLRP